MTDEPTAEDFWRKKCAALAEGLRLKSADLKSRADGLEDASRGLAPTVAVIREIAKQIDALLTEHGFPAPNETRL